MQRFVVTPGWVGVALVSVGITVSAILVGVGGVGSADVPVGAAQSPRLGASSSSTSTPSSSATFPGQTLGSLPSPFRNPLPGMPVVNAGNVYAADVPGNVKSSLAGDPAYLYVPNSFGTPITTVIDQRTRKVVRVLHTGSISQHVTPSYDLTRLYVEASASNQIVALNPRTGKIERTFAVDRPYNLYFTPDGRRGVVMDEQHQKINFTNPRTFKVQKTLSDRSCSGPNHADFSANGRYFLVSCEFSDTLLKISTSKERIIGRLRLPPNSKPQDVRLAPDGRSFYVAAMDANKLLQISWRSLRVIGSTNLPAMPHGIYPSRDGRFLYVSSRMAGEVSVFSLARRKVVDTWKAPPGGTPDMGGVSADGKTLWLSGRTTGYVYGWDTGTGKLVANIHVGGNPHGILVWPQPGRYSLGHTGNMR